MNAILNDTHRKTVGYVLWIFGFTGAHRFYYGKPVTGTIWFLTLGLLGIGWLIDLFLIPSMDRAADRRYAVGAKDYSIAWLLQTFLGLFGLHRFYLRLLDAERPDRRDQPDERPAGVVSARRRWAGASPRRPWPRPCGRRSRRCGSCAPLRHRACRRASRAARR